MKLSSLFDVETYGSEVLRVLPPAVVVVFDLIGEGTYFVARGEDTVEFGLGLPPEWDCRLRCSSEDFRSMLRGEFSGVEGYRTGRLALEGDIGLFFRLHRIAWTRP